MGKAFVNKTLGIEVTPKHGSSFDTKDDVCAEDLIAKLKAAHNSVEGDTQKNHLQAAAAAMIGLEAELRGVATFSELAFFIANQPRRVLGAQQIFVLERNRRGKLTLKAVSSMPSVDRSSALSLALEDLMRQFSLNSDLTQVSDLDLAHVDEVHLEVVSVYPLRYLLWVPFVECDGSVNAGMILARSSAWIEKDRVIAGYVAGAFSHTWQALRSAKKAFRLGKKITRPAATLMFLGLFALSLIPVPMTALAPVEVAPKSPFIVTSGVAGVIKSVSVQPNALVKKGDGLVVIHDTVLRNKYDVARRQVAVAEARYKKASQLAFNDRQGRQDLGVLQAELQVKIAEQRYAKIMLEKTKIRAGMPGVAVFSDVQKLIGRPVNVGERLMEIANPHLYHFKIDLPVADAIVLKQGARVKVFLDSDPLNPVEARLVWSDYRAKKTQDNGLAFRLIADPLPDPPPALRLGVRGTAQVFSDDVTLAFYLFRRPLGVMRQWVGI